MRFADMCKVATNVWTRRLRGGDISEGALARLVDANLVKDHVRYQLDDAYNPVNTDFRNTSKEFIGKARNPYIPTPPTIPLQSPGMALDQRAVKTREAIEELQRVRTQAYASPDMHPISGGMADSTFTRLRNRPPMISMPPMHWSDFPGIHRSTLSHEMAHFRDTQSGPRARGHYDLKDRHLFHRLEKRAPGILMRYPRPETALSEAWAENRSQRVLNPRLSTARNDGRVLSHLRNNYGASAPYTRGLDKLMPAIHGIPLTMQSRMIEPAREGTKQMLAKLLSRIRR